MIEIRGVGKRFGDTLAVQDVSLSVHPGQVFCLLGANGAGKTTLLNICLGFVSPDAGSVAIGGHDLQRAPAAARASLGYVPEQVTLYDALSGIEHLQFFRALGGGRLTSEAAVAALAAAGLPAQAAHRRVGTYSKGMRQKVALAIALAKSASTLLLDEPLSGLDPRSAIELSERLRELGRIGQTVLLTTHDLFRALDTATHIGIMRDGQLRHVAATDGLRYDDLEQRYLSMMEG